ncbi:ATP-dependent DNA helicase 2 subunit 1 [Ixodes scapularis]
MDPQWARDDEEDSDEEGSTEDYKQAVDGVIFLIDATKNMFVATDEEDAFTQCLKAAKSTMLNKITSSPKDKVGVVLFGTEKDSNPSRFKNVYVIQALECPGATTVLNLESLIKDKKSREQYGHGNVCLADALWTCALMFSQCPVGQRRLLVLTNQDDPHAGSAQLDQRARTKAKDLHQSGVEVDLVHLQPPGGGAFRPKLLYQDLVSKDEVYGDEFPEASDKLEELLQRVRLKDHKKRRLASLPFCLGPGLQLSLSLYNLVRPTGKPFPVRLAKDTNEELLSRRLTYAQDNGEVLMPGDIAKCQEYGGKKALFDLSELKQMKAMAPPGEVGHAVRALYSWPYILLYICSTHHYMRLN